MSIERLIRDTGEGPVVNLAGQILAITISALLLGKTWKNSNIVLEILDGSVTKGPYPPSIFYDKDIGILNFHPISNEEYYCRPVSNNLILHYSFDGNYVVGYTRITPREA